MSFSAFAGNPLFISFDMLHEDGLLAQKDLDRQEFSPYFVEFEKAVARNGTLLSRSWLNFLKQDDRTEFEEFCRSRSWLNEYALFMALKSRYKNEPWRLWPKEIRNRDPKSLAAAQRELADQVDYYRFEQYIFHTQWRRLHEYAAGKSVQIIGDLPIYVGADSVDVWAHQRIFELDKTTGEPVCVAGVPPDYFSETGQVWGNPLYCWNTEDGEVKEALYTWWASRLHALYDLVDVLRIDHFRGFESFWSIPARDKTALNGKWVQGPGREFFLEMEKRLGDLPVIAEDLGVITPAVEELRDGMGYPGMKILLFAFDGSPDNAYLPFNYRENCVVYTGAHDNDTVVGWYLDPDVPRDAKQRMKRAANSNNDDASAAHLDCIHLAMSSTARLSILPMQDVLGFGNDCRMNKPATAEGNWVWRCPPQYFTDELAARLWDMTAFFNRLAER